MALASIDKAPIKATQPVSQAKTVPVDQSPVIDLNAVYELVNAERTKVGLPSMARNVKLDATAQIKCDDMAKYSYFGHDSPNGQTYKNIMRNNALWYDASAENIAYGFTNANGVVVGWMNSPTHKENIMRTNLTDVGYAQCEYISGSKFGNRTIIVQHFADPI